MDWLAIRAIHYATLGKAKSLLIKGHSCLYVGNGKRDRYGPVILLVEGINLLCHGAPFGKPRHTNTDLVGPEMRPSSFGVSAPARPTGLSGLRLPLAGLWKI